MELLALLLELLWFLRSPNCPIRRHFLLPRLLHRWPLSILLLQPNVLVEIVGTRRRRYPFLLLLRLLLLSTSWSCFCSHGILTGRYASHGPIEVTILFLVVLHLIVRVEPLVACDHVVVGCES